MKNFIVGILVYSLLLGIANSAIVITDATNISLANSQVEAGGDTSSNSNVVNGLSGNIIPYSSGSTFQTTPYDVSNLNDGDVGVGVFSDGLYSIIDESTGGVTLDFGAIRTLGSIAIYNGYGNRTDGDYLLKDGAGVVMGAWSISGVSGGTNNGVDSFWLTLNTPVNTNGLIIDFSNMESAGGQFTTSFREIQIFEVASVPAPAPVWLLGSGLIGLVGMRKKSAKLSGKYA